MVRNNNITSCISCLIKYLRGRINPKSMKLLTDNAPRKGMHRTDLRLFQQD